jgi:hypothetical protein
VAVKVNPKILMVKKFVIFVPALSLLPWFSSAPTLPRIVLTVLFIPYYFICFMGPVYLLKYFIGVMGLSQKAVDVLFGFGLVMECSLLAWGLADAFAFGSEPIESAMFLVPLWVFVRTMAAMSMLAMALAAFGYGAGGEED